MKRYILLFISLFISIGLFAQVNRELLTAQIEQFNILKAQYLQNRVYKIAFNQYAWANYAPSDSLTNEAKWLDLYSQLIRFASIKQKASFEDLVRQFKHNDTYKGQAFLGLINTEYLSPNSDYTSIETLLAAKQNPFESKQLFVATILGTAGNDLVKISPEFLVGDFEPDDSLVLHNEMLNESYRLGLNDEWRLPLFKSDQLFRLSLIRNGKELGFSALFIKKVTQHVSEDKIVYLHQDYCGNVRGGGYNLPYYDPTEWIPEKDYSFTATATIPYDIPMSMNPAYYQGWLENDRLASPYGKADVSIIYADGRNYLKKPLIFLDGYEFFDDILSDRVNSDPDLGGYLGFQMRKFPQLWCEICQPGPAAGQLVKNYMREGCYDIVIVNWHGGADFVQRNAFALIEVLNQLNAMKVGDEPNILVGPSMGGVIAQYALAYSEAHEGEPNVKAHEVGVFISDDAPLYGANIPIGVQYAVANLTMNLTSLSNFTNGVNEIIAIPDAIDFLNIIDPLPSLEEKKHQALMALFGISSPCALQILNYSIFGSTYQLQDGTVLGSASQIYTYQQYIDNIGNNDLKVSALNHHPFFDQLQTELAAIGHFPKNCQLLAMANASGALHPHQNENPITHVVENMLPESLIFTIDEGADAKVTTRALPATGTNKVISDVDLRLRDRQVVRIDGQSNLAADHAPGGFVSMLDRLDDGNTSRVYTKHFCHEYLNSTLGFERTWTNQNGNFELTLCNQTVEQYMPHTPFDRIHFPCYDNTKHTWIPQDYLDFLDDALRHIYFQNRAFTSGELNIAAKESILIGDSIVAYKPIGEVVFANGDTNGKRLSAGTEIKVTSGTIIKPSANFKATINTSYIGSCTNTESIGTSPEISDNYILTKSIKCTSPDNLLIYPNPNQGTFQIIMNNYVKENTVLEVVDTDGKVVYHTTLERGISSTSIDVATLKSGIYVLSIFDGKKPKTAKLIIQK